MKKNHLILAAVILGVIAALYWLTRKSAQDLRDYLISWANTTTDAALQARRVSAISAMPDSEVKSLYKIVTEYFNTNTPVTPDLQEFWNYATAKYGI